MHVNYSGPASNSLQVFIVLSRKLGPQGVHAEFTSYTYNAKTELSSKMKDTKIFWLK